ncbi:SOS-response transcriptional repressor LexA (RecA-mediated autopeptidase) [Sulfobacillus thermosulfidooxidans DSM 9293]|uniref:SOS-response transcriptional repressor LexA (RecA-mediated autopeptidase) n=1 Tax=Sulfobacillus thermosulfidooxidans (strain DSM 9293 / VKM B-1269 / AT-1) TaxID=929705 RepID=A0A1W1W710_SULTA|nr:LexA family transcriptional regulator [Sulfobacillus thermosulfidooxidans]SMC02074.1 SOS-response transcriptional repressor LexA (RecA-mediated autopeptidase) [Sulfobacillus thermosulfidooxidans DSM 9293]
MKEQSFGVKLQAIRKRLGLSQTDLAKMIGTTQNNISRYEQGLRRPSFDTLKRISDALNVSMDELSDGAIIEFNRNPIGVTSPSWASFVFSLQNAYQWTTEQLAQQLQIPLDELLPPRSTGRPSVQAVQAIASFLGVSQLSIAILAGYMDRDTTLDAIIDLMQWPWRKLAPYHSDWYNRHGGAFLRACRTAQDQSIDTVVHRWNTYWDRSLTIDDWNLLESQGVLRTPWDSHHPTARLDELPGIWLWALVMACETIPGSLYSDVVGLTALLGRISTKGPLRQVWFTGNRDYEMLIAAFDITLDKAHDTLDVVSFRERVRTALESTPASVAPSTTPPLPVRSIPLLGRVVAGIPVEAQADQQGELRIPQEDPGDFAVIVHGDSMVHAGITEGDVVIAEQVQPGQDVPSQSLVIALVNGEQTLKWLMRDTDGTWWLRAANPQYPDIPLDPQRDRVVGLVRGIQRRPPAPSSASSRPVASSDSWDDLTPDQRDLLAAQQQMIAEQQQLLQAMLVRFRRMNQAARSRASRPDDNDPQDPPF